MKRRYPLMVGLCLMMLIVASGTMTVAESAAGEEHDKLEMAAAAKITIDEAIKMASEKMSGTVIEAELDRKHGKLIWEVEVVTAEHKIMEVHIDAETGTFIDIEEEKAKSGRFKRPRS
ncbi:MAG: PepSY domain-containing protein [Nitrospira sp.]